MKRVKKVLAMLLTGCVLFNSTNLEVLAEENVSKLQEKTVAEISGDADAIGSHDGWDGSATKSVYDGGNYMVTFSLTEIWDGGYNAVIRIVNTGEGEIVNWQLGFEYPGVVSNPWNAVISSQENGRYIFKNVGWNQGIAAGSYVEFGFGGQGSFCGFPEQYEILGSKQDAREEDYTIEYRLNSDWGSGFTGMVTITNNTDRTLEDWVLEFDFDRSITTIWNGVIESVEGMHYVVKNAGYNRNIMAGGKVSFGFMGVGGDRETRPGNYWLYTYGIGAEYRVIFEAGAADVDNMPETQTVQAGKYAVKPDYPIREGYIFMGWYEDEELTKYFDFDSMTVGRNMTLYAKWFHYMDRTDTDGDGIPDALEELFGLNPRKADTDEDGLSDYLEINDLYTDALLADTDGNGVNDGDEDYDGDGLTNCEELSHGTELTVADTDGDLLSDGDEIKIYGTDPLRADTDGDGVSDGKEIEIGTDPLRRETSFTVTQEAKDNGSVKAAVEITLQGDQVETLSVEPVGNQFLFPTDMPGYIGDAYEFRVKGSFEEAIIRFTFDAALPGQDGFDPVIYYFNEEEQQLEPLPTTVSGNTACTEVTHFSKYILVNRRVYQDSFLWVDEWNTDCFSSAEVVLVIDDSGSMRSNDRYNQRLAVAKTLIDKLPLGSKVGIVKFTYGATKLTLGLTDDKESAKGYLTTKYFTSNGGASRMYAGINGAFSLFGPADDDTLRMMVVLSDGEADDTRLHAAAVSTANAQKVQVYTVGLGSNTGYLKRYFENYLKPLANNTAGSFYLASQASDLAEIYDRINQKIDISLDTDGDGIPDFYEDNMIMFNGVKLKLDKLNPDTDGDGLLDGEEIVELKYEYNADKSKVKVTGKLKSDPTSIDTDGDGLYDGTARTVNGRIVAPIDPDSTQPNGLPGMWDRHVKQQESGTVCTEYLIDYEVDEEALSAMLRASMGVDVAGAQELADGLVGLVLKFREPVNANEENLRGIALILKMCCKMKVSPALGAFLLNFMPDDKLVAYHSQPDTWQRFFGYNAFYDELFNIGSKMSYQPFPFTANSGNYVLWLWKGDYWNLNSGAEMGLYVDSGKDLDSDITHYHAIDFEVPMTLSLYNYYGDDDIDDIFSWAPDKEQWWITGFSGYHKEFAHPDTNVMVSVGSVDLSGHEELYEGLKNAENDYRGSKDHDAYKNYLIFDDAKQTVWVMFYKGVQHAEK